MLTLHLVLLILAAVLFLGAALHVEHQRISFLPLGLCLWVVAELLAGR